MANIIIYPQGNTGNTDPHTVFDDGTNKLQFNENKIIFSITQYCQLKGQSIQYSHLNA